MHTKEGNVRARKVTRAPRGSIGVKGSEISKVQGK